LVSRGLQLVGRGFPLVAVGTLFVHAREALGRQVRLTHDVDQRFLERPRFYALDQFVHDHALVGLRAFLQTLDAFSQLLHLLLQVEGVVHLHFVLPVELFRDLFKRNASISILILLHHFPLLLDHSGVPLRRTIPGFLTEIAGVLG